MGSDGARGMVLSCLARSEGNFLNGKTPELGYIYMNGQEVFKFAVKKVPECINQVLSESKTEIGAIKYFVLHQANYRDVYKRQVWISGDRGIYSSLTWLRQAQ